MPFTLGCILSPLRGYRLPFVDSVWLLASIYGGLVIPAIVYIHSHASRYCSNLDRFWVLLGNRWTDVMFTKASGGKMYQMSSGTM